MKKLSLLILLLISGLTVAQEKKTDYPQDINKKHEVKINTFSLIAFKWLDVSYEQLINEESSFGVAALVSLNNETDIYRNYSITPYYRRYFSKQYARGFFIEGFGMLHNYDQENDDYYHMLHSNNTFNNNPENKTEFAVGVSVGGKFVSKRGFSTEVYLGLGRNFTNNYKSHEAIGRFGISFGYRF